MSYTVIARKYRPKSFDDLIGQKPIADTLKNAILMKKIHHAYLFAGPRGVGKTSCARILAKAVNCKQGPTVISCDNCSNCKEITGGISMDVMEIDGASNRGIDEIRDLKEKINYTPMNSNYKIYIIDEVHMLTPEAFNALLKTLEEPPPHIIFIFATTEPHKIPLTVLSRCQRFDFRRITMNEITGRLQEISLKENIKADKDSLFLISKIADGSMRDAQSALDQLIAYSEGEINPDKVRKMFGLLTSDIYYSFLTSIRDNDVKEGITFITEIYNQGSDLKLFIINFVDFLRNLLLIKNGIEDELILEENKEEISHLKQLSSFFDLEIIDEMIKYLISVLENFRYSAQFKILLETAFFNLINISKKITLRFIYDYIKSFSDTDKDEKIDVSRNKIIKNLLSPSPISAENKQIAPASTPKNEDKIEKNDTSEQTNIIENGSNNTGLWNNIIAVINKEKPRIGSLLKKGSLKENKDGMLSITINNQFFFESLNNQIKDIEDIIKNKLQQNFKIKFELLKSDEPDIKNKEKSDPFITKAQQIFKGTIIKGGT